MRQTIGENQSLATLTTLGIGGRARYFVEASTEDEVTGAIAFARSKSIPLLVLGGGSNLLVADDGFPGLVLRMAIGGVSREEAGRTVRVSVGAGIDWDWFVSDCVQRGLHGVECLSGIPGRVGGTPVQNVGAYGQEVSSVISRVRVYDHQDETLRDLSRPDCQFAYRSSVFNGPSHGRHIVLAVEYELGLDGPPELSYPDLERVFEGQSPPRLADVRNAVLGIRMGKAMLLVEGDPDCRSAGSFFRNPVLSPGEFSRLEERAAKAGYPGIPRYPRGDEIKVPAAWLVEAAGFPRGTARGPVGLSSRHALALVNRGGARASDVIGFADEIRRAVEGRFGVRLRTEPAFVGFPDEVVERFGAVVGSA